MAEVKFAQDATDKQTTDSAAGPAGESALKAIAHLQKVAETLAADAAKLDDAAVADKTPEVAVEEEKSRRKGRLAFLALSALAQLSPSVWAKAAVVGALGAGIAGSAYLGMRDGAHNLRAERLAAERAAQLAPETPTERELRAKLAAVTQELQSLRAQTQKQAAELRAAQSHASAASAAASQTSARLDRVEKDISSRFEQQTVRVERLERLAADPVVTSAIGKSHAASSPSTPAPPQRQGLRTPDPTMAPNAYVLRSVRNGIAVVQTRNGLIEVGPGDSIPGVGRVKRIEKIDGRWIVVMRDGVIDQDAD